LTKLELDFKIGIRMKLVERNNYEND